MIKKEELLKIGKLNKPHGIKGEISFSFTDDSFSEDENSSFLIVELEGICVPFLLEEIRFTSDSSALIQLKNVDSDKKARQLTNKEVFYPKKCVKIPEKNFRAWNYFIGFTVFDENNNKIGKITDVDDTTINVLFVVEREGNSVLLPAVQDFILRIDDNRKTLSMQLLDGLLEI
ncbi:MAG: ribosome maturation factor RimM [Dysgonamonadaceae bacterium]|jgi:16S rRNA processing protein RimM|nr:ribosome maturation factor RimM [Dysgonamonadaceae bacterium]